MFPESIYRVTEAELARFPAEARVVRSIKTGTPTSASGNTFYIGDPSRMLVLQSIVVRAVVTANAGAETRIWRQNVEMLDAVDGSARGQLWDITIPDVAGDGLVPNGSTTKAVMAAGAPSRIFSWNVPECVGVVLPAGITLRHQSWCGGGLPAFHGQENYLVGYVIPIGHIGRA